MQVYHLTDTFDRKISSSTLQEANRIGLRLSSPTLAMKLVWYVWVAKVSLSMFESSHVFQNLWSLFESLNVQESLSPMVSQILSESSLVLLSFSLSLPESP